MATYRMEDGTVVKTENATRKWEEQTDWNGQNHISRATQDQWRHENLYRSRKGRFYIQHWSNWEGERDWCEWVSPQRAAAWLLLMEYELPDDLREYEEDISE